MERSGAGRDLGLGFYEAVESRELRRLYKEPGTVRYGPSNAAPGGEHRVPGKLVDSSSAESAGRACPSVKISGQDNEPSQRPPSH